MRRIGLLLGLGVVCAAPVHAATRQRPPDTCVTGRFLLDEGTGALLATIASPGALVMAPEAVALGTLCGPGRPRTLRRMRGDRVRVVVHWPACNRLRGRVRLRAVLAADCNALTGTVRARGFRSAIAAHRSRCGDGRVDPEQQEVCDGTAGGCTACTDDCRCIAPPICPTGVAGDPRTAPVIRIDEPAPGARTIQGRVERASGLRLVGWARTDRFYVQPRLDAPFTTIGSDGTFRLETAPWDQVVVLLVDDTYVVPAGPSLDHHPGTDPGVRAWAESPPGRRIEFAGRCWHVKDSTPHPTGPGPMVFAATDEHVRVDEAGALHLAVERSGGTWAGAEVVTTETLGFGDYTYQVETELARLPVPLVFSGFLFASLTREIDIEFSRTITASCAGPVGADAQFVIQPFTRPGNRQCFVMPAGVPTTHRIRWRADRAEFTSWEGLSVTPPADGAPIRTWTYTGADVPGVGGVRMRFNLWLVAGILPAHVPHEVLVRGFTFTPAAAGGS